MSTATATPPATPPATALPQETVGDLLHRLGDVSPNRVRLDPPLCQAKVADLIAVNEQSRGVVCEWVEGTLVEKPMGQFESWISMIIGGELYVYLKAHDIGMLYGEAAVLEILPGIGR